MRLFKLQTILVATDLTETSVGAMVSAARLASAAGATLHVAHVASEQNELNADADRRAEYEQAIGNAVDAAKTRHVAHDRATRISTFHNGGADTPDVRRAASRPRLARR